MNSQSNNGKNPPSPDSNEFDRTGLINSILEKFDQYYIYPEVAKQMKSLVLDKLEKHQYDKCPTVEALAGQLTSDMRGVAEDGHIAVYPAGLYGFLTAEGDTLTDKQKAEAARRNYGFLELKRLTGNIGYLKLSYFEHPSIAGPTAAAAMQFLANTDAIIIDLRDNIGGEEAMVQFLLSYFFERQKLLLNVYNNKNELIEQSWTYSFVPGKKMVGTDLYALISPRTGSGAEAFVYDLKCFKRGSLIGETTKGIAHMVNIIDLKEYGTRIHVPFKRPASPITNTCWEKCGVKPDMEIPEEQALTAAFREALKNLIARCNDDDIRRDLEWTLPLVEMQGNPIVLSEKEQKKYIGIYNNGKYSIISKNEKLYWRYSETTDYVLIPISAELFGFSDTEDDRLQFVRNDKGDITGFQLIRKSGDKSTLRFKTGEL